MTPRSALVEVVESFLAESGRHVGPLAAMIIRANYNVRGRLTFYLFEAATRRPTFVVKLGRTSRARRLLAAERDSYEALLARSEFLKRQRPRLYSRGGDPAFVAEEFVPGGSVERLRGSAAYETVAVEWLAAFQAASAGRPLRKPDLQETLQHLRAAPGLEPFHSLVDDTTARANALADFEVAEVPVHGDFAPANLLLDGRRLYVTDWEWLRPGGWPLEDLWWFLIVSAKSLGGAGVADGDERVLNALTGSGPYAERMRDVARTFAAARRVPTGLVPVLAIVTLLEMTLRWREERIDWQTARTAEYERALRGLLEREREFWDWWAGGEHGRD